MEYFYVLYLQFHKKKVDLVHMPNIAVTFAQINMTVLELLKSKNARAVVVIAEKTTAKGIVWAASLLSPGTFIWIGTSAWSEEILGRKDLDQNFFGSILVMPSQFGEQSQYKQYFQQLKPVRCFLVYILNIYF